MAVFAGGQVRAAMFTLRSDRAGCHPAAAAAAAAAVSAASVRAGAARHVAFVFIRGRHRHHGAGGRDVTVSADPPCREQQEERRVENRARHALACPDLRCTFMSRGGCVKRLEGRHVESKTKVSRTDSDKEEKRKKERKEEEDRNGGCTAAQDLVLEQTDAG